MDKVYKGDIPAMVKALEQLQAEFARVESKTDWVNLRVKPLLQHARTLQKIIESPRFARETNRLTRGVRMFRSDRVYLRTNIEALRGMCESVSKSSDETIKRRTR